MKTLQEANIILHVPSEDKHAAIERVGNKLVENGYVEPPYVEGMFAREASITTYIGNGVAIPHSMPEYVQHIIASGVVIAQYPDGVDFGDGNTAYLVFGIAGKGEEHMAVLSQIAIVCMEQANVDKLVQAKSTNEIMNVLAEGGAQ